MLSTPAASAKDRSVVESTRRKRTLSTTAASCEVRVHPSTRIAELGSDKDHGVARDAVWRCWHLVHLDLIIVVAAVQGFVQNFEGHRA